MDSIPLFTCYCGTEVEVELDDIDLSEYEDNEPQHIGGRLVCSNEDCNHMYHMEVRSELAERLYNKEDADSLGDLDPVQVPTGLFDAYREAVGEDIPSDAFEPEF